MQKVTTNQTVTLKILTLLILNANKGQAEKRLFGEFQLVQIEWIYV